MKFGPKIFMAHTAPSSSVVHARLLKPLTRAMLSAKNLYECRVLSDVDWLQFGVRRCLELCQSGRDFLQGLADVSGLHVGLSTFFESLKSKRRHALSREMNTALLRQLQTQTEDPLACYDPTGSLDGFDLYAGDGHFHSAACHDPRMPRKPSPRSVPVLGSSTEPSRLQETTKYPVGHLYCLNLRTQGLSHLCLLDQITRKKEHDLRALKALSADILRQGAAKGRKVLLVWDRAAIDFQQWHRWKHQNGIYFLSREKENMRLDTLGSLFLGLDFKHQCGCDQR
jgi:hypothetical protein